jgi:hypothetical protein
MCIHMEEMQTELYSLKYISTRIMGPDTHRDCNNILLQIKYSSAVRWIATEIYSILH